MKQPRPPRVDDVVHIHGDTDLWKIIAITPDTVTATSLNAYPRIDTTVPTSRVTRAHQE